MRDLAYVMAGPVVLAVWDGMEEDAEVLRFFNAKVGRLDRSGRAKRYAYEIPKITLATR